MKNSISVMPPAEKRIYNIFFVVIVLLYAVCSFFTEFSPLAVLANLDQFWLFLSEDFFPPQFPTDIRMYNILDSVGVTIAMAISSTTIAGILAFFYGAFCQRACIAVSQMRKICARLCHFPAQYTGACVGVYTVFLAWHRHGRRLCGAFNNQLCLYGKGVYGNNGRYFGGLP